jgi:hypothetical protein
VVVISVAQEALPVGAGEPVPAGAWR